MSRVRPPSPAPYIRRWAFRYAVPSANSVSGCACRAPVCPFRNLACRGSWCIRHESLTQQMFNWRGTQVVRERSAKPLCVGSIPTRASNLFRDLAVATALTRFLPCARSPSFAEKFVQVALAVGPILARSIHPPVAQPFSVLRSSHCFGVLHHRLALVLGRWVDVTMLHNSNRAVNSLSVLNGMKVL
jgi:hypothetical protein